jgi:hypothetical protein
MAKKWYELFVSVEPSTSRESVTESASSGEGTPSAAQTVAEIASTIGAEPAFTQVHGPAAFDEIYKAADISAPSHGYTITKVAEMLQSEHIRNLPAEVKRSSILLALEAAGVKLKEVIEDAVRRDRALDTYERVLQKSVEELETAKKEENQQIEAELERIMAEHRTRLQANNDALAREKEKFFGWRLQKQQEEKKIADAVSYFVSENPISVGSSAAAAPAKPAGNQSSTKE